MRIGLLTTIVHNRYGQALIQSLCRELKNYNCQLIIFEGYSLMNNSVSDYQYNTVYRMVSRGRIDALVLSGQLSSRAGKELVQDLALKVGIPVVSFGIELENIPSVVTDNFSGFSQIVSHLVSHGYKKLAHISGPLRNPEALIRRDAFLKVIYQNGLEVPQNFILEGNFSDISGYNLTKRLIPYIKSKKIDAIVCTNDDTAFGAIKCLNDNGLEVPGDVAVTGFDDAAASLGIINTLTTVAQPFGEMCRKVAELIMEPEKSDNRDMVYTINPRLVIRNSCGCNEVRFSGTSADSGLMLGSLSSRGRFQSLENGNFWSALTECLTEYGMNSCYIVRFLAPVRFDDNSASVQGPKGTLIYGFSSGRAVHYPKAFDVSAILPNTIFSTLEGVVLVKLIFIGKSQLGYIVMSAPENMTGFMAQLCLEIQQHVESTFLTYEKQQVEQKLSDTLERLINTNRKLNELTVRNNLDRLKHIRFLANNMLQSRKPGGGDYYVILAEIDNFFEIDSRYGFEESEFVMNSVSKVLAGCIREDDFLSHQSCDRYVILIKNVQGDVIKSIDERFQSRINELNESLEKPYRISLTWGYSRGGIDSDFEKVYMEAEADLAKKKLVKGIQSDASI